MSKYKAHFVAATGEFVGTFFFLYFGYAGNMMAIRQSPFPQVNGGFASTTDMWIAMSYGFSFLVNAWAFYRISGGLFNPAVNETSSLFNQTLGSNYGVAGYPRFMARRTAILAARGIPCPCADTRIHVCWWPCRRDVPRVCGAGKYNSWKLYLYHKGFVLGDVLYSSARFCCLDAGCRKVPRYFHGAYWHWTYLACHSNPW
jgi:hypothetical protein